MKYKGSCHCGAIQFEVDAPEHIEASECDCSICAKSGYLHLNVSKPDLTIISGELNTTTYSFNTGIAKHTFCKICGIKPFYTPRSRPGGYSVNVHCLDTKPKKISIRQFDGVNWEKTMENLTKSK